MTIRCLISMYFAYTYYSYLKPGDPVVRCGLSSSDLQKSHGKIVYIQYKYNQDVFRVGETSSLGKTTLTYWQEGCNSSTTAAISVVTKYLILICKLQRPRSSFWCNISLQFKTNNMISSDINCCWCTRESWAFIVSCFDAIICNLNFIFYFRLLGWTSWYDLLWEDR